MANMDGSLCGIITVHPNWDCSCFWWWWCWSLVLLADSWFVATITGNRLSWELLVLMVSSNGVTLYGALLSHNALPFDYRVNKIGNVDVDVGGCGTWLQAQTSAQSEQQISEWHFWRRHERIKSWVIASSAETKYRFEGIKKKKKKMVFASLLLGDGQEYRFGFKVFNHRYVRGEEGKECDDLQAYWEHKRQQQKEEKGASNGNECWFLKCVIVYQVKNITVWEYCPIWAVTWSSCSPLRLYFTRPSITHQGRDKKNRKIRLSLRCTSQEDQQEKKMKSVWSSSSYGDLKRLMRRKEENCSRSWLKGKSNQTATL